MDSIRRTGSSGITYHDLLERWQHSAYCDHMRLSKATFHRFCDDIEDIFDISIVCNRSTNCYHIEDTVALNDTHSFRQWMLDVLSLDNQIGERQQLRDRVIVESLPGGRDCLSPLLEAMQENHKVNFIYAPFWTDDIFEDNGYMPYALKNYHRRWYMLGCSEERPYLRTFALDRMSHVEVTDTKFVLPKDFDAESFFSDYYGIFCNSETGPERLVLKVENSQVPYLRTLPLHHTQRELKSNNDYTEFEYKLALTFDLRQEILSYGPSYVVEEPKWFRDALLKDITLMREKYFTSNQ